MSRLKSIREKLNITQEELSAQSGISVRTIQRIEAGNTPKGYTLKTLAKVLQVEENELLEAPIEQKTEPENKENNSFTSEEDSSNYSTLKLINLSSILFVILPPLNILAPLLFGWIIKKKSPLIKQMVSLQIVWTILAPIIFMIFIFMKLGRAFTIYSILFLVLSNVYIILRNTYELDKNKKLYYQLNFSML